MEKFGDLRSGERFKDVDLCAGQQRRDHFKGRIFRGRPDKNDVARFDVRKESILLGFVEAVNFIDEDDRAVAGFGFQFRSGHDFLDFLDAGQDRAERDEAGFGEPRNQTS